MRDQLISAGIKNLKEFGYLSVTAETILTDYIYSRMFEKMLTETMELARRRRGDTVAACKSLLKEINTKRV